LSGKVEQIPFKQCTCCNKELPTTAEYFHQDVRTKNGYHSWCKVCRNEAEKSFSRITSKDRWWNSQKKRKKYQQQKKADNPRYRFDLITMPYTPKKCPVFGQELIYSAYPNSCFGASIDRIDSSKPYIDDNVMVLSLRANLLKNDATFQELVLMGRWAQCMIDSGYN
jgi:hypothetical protein